MRAKSTVIAILLVCIFASDAAAAIDLYFDSSGNLLHGRPTTEVRLLSARAARSSVPEGVNLRPYATYEFFPVSGGTYSEVVRSAEENAPVRRGVARRFPSGLEWSFGLSFDFDYTYEIDEEDGTVHASLDVRDTKIEYILTITLPVLIDNTALNPVEQDLWKAYLRRLLDSEYSKADIIIGKKNRDRAAESLSDITYIIFDYGEGVDIDKTINIFLREEGARIGKETARRIREQLADYDRRSTSGKKKR